MYSLEDYDYHLPEELIAQEPAPRRDESRLSLVERATEHLADHRFFELPALLREGDLLVVNDAKVVPARLFGQKETGGRVEILVLEHPTRSPAGAPDKRWCLLRASKRPKIGSKILFPDGLKGTVTHEGREGKIQLRFEGAQGLDAVLEKRGCLPLPPYIKRDSNDRRSEIDKERYQTIFSRFVGAVAAPTAGLHFTPELIDSLHCRGVRIASITLMVGHDTFKPVRTREIREHHVGEEEYSVGHDTAKAIADTKRDGGRIISIGTTVVRALETMFQRKGKFAADSGSTDLFIYPGFNFQVTDGLLTNFHLPRSSLLFLVAAFAGYELTMKAYRWAVENRYRFYSYGDAMLIT
ncbi:MAG: tRNA preQ1(34) S-adenosylmethionine ribosyltransferase-isomerase QueA [Deltaproteobacteria bacterium]|nr:tRNA preQ1(34) S-adenosylmethionine ribosyltransferase-isomerase QueA [Deltaproteobacteria bacterium]